MRFRVKTMSHLAENNSATILIIASSFQSVIMPNLVSGVLNLFTDIMNSVKYSLSLHFSPFFRPNKPLKTFVYLLETDRKEVD